MSDIAGEPRLALPPAAALRGLALLRIPCLVASCRARAINPTSFSAVAGDPEDGSARHNGRVHVVFRVTVL